MWSYGAIERSWSTEIASGDDANAKLWILWRHVKSLTFRCFWVDLCKTLANNGQEMKVSTRMKKFNFWVKYAVFIKNENDFFFKILIFATHDLKTIFNQCSKFQNDLINILGDMTS